MIIEEYWHTPNDDYGTSSGTGSNRLFSKDHFGHPRLTEGNELSQNFTTKNNNAREHTEIRLS